MIQLTTPLQLPGSILSQISLLFAQQANLHMITSVLMVGTGCVRLEFNGSSREVPESLRRYYRGRGLELVQSLVDWLSTDIRSLAWAQDLKSMGCVRTLDMFDSGWVIFWPDWQEQPNKVVGHWKTPTEDFYGITQPQRQG